MLRIFLRDSFSYAIPAFVSRGLSLLLIPIYSRVLTPSNFGALDMLLVFGGLINLTIALEVSQGVARFHADSPAGADKVIYSSSAFWFTVGCYSLFCLIALLNSQVLAQWVMGQSGLEEAFRLGILYISLNGIFYLIQNQFRWELRSRRYAESSLLVTFVTAAAVIWFTYALDLGVLGLLGGMSLGAALGIMYGCWHLRDSFKFTFDGHHLREMLQYSAPLVPAGLAIWFSSYIDRLMINHYLSLNEVGLYGIGYRLSSVVGLLVSGIQGALMPLVLRNYQAPETPSQLARIFRVFLAFALLVFLGLSVFAYDILVAMTTQDFYGASALVIYLVPAAMLAQMYVFAPGISIAKKTHLYIWINLFGVTVNGAVGWCLIPSMGVTGAAVATLVGNACIFAPAMWVSQRLYPVPHDWTRLVAAAAVACALAALIPYLSPSDWGRRFLAVAGIGVMAGAVIALGLVRRDEIARTFRELRERLAF